MPFNRSSRSAAGSYGPRMQVFYIGVINDNRPPASEYACGVEVLVSAASRMDATAALRERGFTAVRSRDLTPLESRKTEPDGRSMPPVAPGEVWARTVYVDGTWEKR